MSHPTEEFLKAARARFYALAQLPDPANVKPIDLYMETWKLRGAGDPTLAFIQRNVARIAEGLPPLGADGLPIEAVKLNMPPPLAVIPEIDPDDFFSQTPGAKIARRG